MLRAVRNLGVGTAFAFTAFTAAQAASALDHLYAALVRLDGQQYVACSAPPEAHRTVSVSGDHDHDGRAGATLDQEAWRVFGQSFADCFSGFLTEKLDEAPTINSLDALRVFRTELRTVRREVLQQIYLVGYQKGSSAEPDGADETLEDIIKDVQACINEMRRETGKWTFPNAGGSDPSGTPEDPPLGEGSGSIPTVWSLSAPLKAACDEVNDSMKDITYYHADDSL